MKRKTIIFLTAALIISFLNTGLSKLPINVAVETEPTIFSIEPNA